jgi:hypothetical protein
MIRVYAAPTMAMVAHVRAVLEGEGIACVVRNEFLGAGAGELPPIECWPEVSGSPTTTTWIAPGRW